MRPNLWPTEIPGFRDHLYGMFEALDALGRKLLKGIARYLNLGDDFFEDKVELGNSVLRMLHYPPVPADAPGVRAGAHEDINVITLLLGAEEAGLQLKDANGEWLDIAPPPGALVVNIGDMLQRLTNHVLPSTTHRVVNPAPERRGFARYSTPFFLHFNPDYVIETLPSTITPENPDRYAGQPIMAEDFLTQRLKEIRLL
jgi:isopenicillin N synthase-like dioxygenase